jgi:type I thyroxine 5'-deiodinase
VQFFCIYIWEAHPEDGWQVPSNLHDQILYRQPKTDDARAAIAQTCLLRLNLDMPMLLDTQANEVDSLYAAWPERLYLLDHAGIVTYRSDPGPWGFDVDAWEEAIRTRLGLAPRNSTVR